MSPASEQLRIELDAVEDRLLRQRDALVRLTGQQLANCDELPQTVRRILEVSSETLRVARVSVWMFNAARTAISCTDLYEADLGRHSCGVELTGDDYPAYFAALDASDVVVADEAQSDPNTREFTATYLRPLGITSMIDAPIHAKGLVVGVLCHEHTGPVRRWTSDEKSFVVSVSNLLALAMERCERSRVESTSLLQAAALDAAADATLITDRDGLIVWTNPAFTQLTGYPLSESVGRHPRDLLRSGLYDRAYYDTLWKTLKAGRVWRGEMTNRRKDGSMYVEDQTITPVRNSSNQITHFVAVKRDLTEKRALEARFLQAQKMEVVGRLAGGVAHDFNNLLTVINGTAELALSDLDENHPLANDLRQIRESGIRAASLTRQLLAFSRKQVAKRERVDVGGLLEGFRGLLQRLIGEDIDLHVEHGPAATPILADASQIEQVVLNLVVNSRDAMPTGGELWIQVDQVNLGADFVARHAGAKPGPYVQIVVKDTGAGMPPEILARLFEPFFTTKDAGKGTGLGLATVDSIVAQTGGIICVESEVGQGTTFRLYFPRIAEPETILAQPAAIFEQSGQTVLVVEDEADVRQLAVRILASAGYVVLAASNTSEALLLLESTAKVDILLTDVVLRGESGRELAERAVALRPNLAVLFTSGYTTDIVLSHGVRDNTAAFIGKPYSQLGLVNKISEVLTRQRGGK